MRSSRIDLVKEELKAKLKKWRIVPSLMSSSRAFAKFRYCARQRTRHVLGKHVRMLPVTAT